MRYAALILLNAPVVLLALFNLVTQYKMKKVSVQRFRHQIVLWVAILLILILSFPLYNYLSGAPLFSSAELSLFDIVQTTVVIALIYAFNSHRQKIETNERLLRDLHQELSIKLAGTNGKD